MKHIAIILIISIIGILVWVLSDFRSFSKNDYLDKKVLDMASPVNVTIDTGFLEKLNSAYEQ